MTVSEKHIAAAIDLVDSEMFKGLMAVDRIGKCAEMVAAALAAAEREGMRRAAEIASKCGADAAEFAMKKFDRPSLDFQRFQDGCNSVASAILSQANTHSVALPPGATEQAGTVYSSAVSATHHASRNGEGA